MKKTKTKLKKSKPGKQSLLGGAAKSIKKLRKSKFSTAQKVLAGAALAAVGLSLFAKRAGKNGASATPDPTAAEQHLAEMDANA